MSFINEAANVTWPSPNAMLVYALALASKHWVVISDLQEKDTAKDR
jgi:hypothetical protein